MDILEKVSPVEPSTKSGSSISFYYIFICFSFLLPLTLVVYELFIQKMTSGDMVLPDIFWQLGGNGTISILIFVCFLLFIADIICAKIAKKSFLGGAQNYRVISTSLNALSIFNLVMCFFAWFLSLGFHGYWYF
jgi:hypothetical protein